VQKRKSQEGSSLNGKVENIGKNGKKKLGVDLKQIKIPPKWRNEPKQEEERQV